MNHRTPIKRQNAFVAQSEEEVEEIMSTPPRNTTYARVRTPTQELVHRESKRRRRLIDEILADVDPMDWVLDNSVAFGPYGWYTWTHQACLCP